MTARHNIWLMKDESAQQNHGAVRADAITAITTQQINDVRRLSVTVEGKGTYLGACVPEHHDRMINGLFGVLAMAEKSEADFVVIEAVPRDVQDGSDQTFWWVHENEWPVPRGASADRTFRQVT